MRRDQTKNYPIGEETITIPKAEALETYRQGYDEGVQAGYQRAAADALQMAYIAFLQGYKDLYPATGKRKLMRLFWASNDALRRISRISRDDARKLWSDLGLDGKLFDALGGSDADDSQGVFRTNPPDTGGD